MWGGGTIPRHSQIQTEFEGHFANSLVPELENGWHLSITGDRQTDNMETTKNKVRASCWSVTINNPTPEDEEEIALARQAGWKVDGQLEKGEDGTPHYQLIVKTPQVRFAQVKKAFRRAHIEAARSAPALAKYCDKPETRVEKLAASSDQYPSLSKFWHLISKELDAKNPYLVASWGNCCDWDESKGGKQLTPLEGLKWATGMLIMQGYHVESIASNPLTKSTWKDYHFQLCVRAAADFKEEEVVEEPAFGTAVELPVVNTQHATQTEEEPQVPPRTPCSAYHAAGADSCPTCRKPKRT